jgi:hypothetical protein
MIRIAQIVEHSIWEYQNGNIKLAESMLNYALKLAKKKKSPKYKGTSKNVPTIWLCIIAAKLKQRKNLMYGLPLMALLI